MGGAFFGASASPLFCAATGGKAFDGGKAGGSFHQGGVVGGLLVMTGPEDRLAAGSSGGALNFAPPALVQGGGAVSCPPGGLS